MRVLLLAAALLFAVASTANAKDYCDRYAYGSPEWWNCVAQDRETGD